MKTAFRLAILAVALVAVPSRCFALWEIEQVDKKRAAELGMEIRSSAGGPNHVRVEFEFKMAGALKSFAGDDTGRTGRVELRVGQQNNPPITAPLREDRSKVGRVVVEFIADVAQLDRLSLWVMIPGELGGNIFDLRIKDFVDAPKREADAEPGQKKAAPKNGPAAAAGNGRYQMLVWGTKENPYLVLLDTQTGQAWSTGFAGPPAREWEDMKTPPSPTGGASQPKQP
jgi:hypothetical protein